MSSLLSQSQSFEITKIDELSPETLILQKKDLNNQTDTLIYFNIPQKKIIKKEVIVNLQSWTVYNNSVYIISSSENYSKTLLRVLNSSLKEIKIVVFDKITLVADFSGNYGLFYAPDTLLEISLNDLTISKKYIKQPERMYLNTEDKTVSDTLKSIHTLYDVVYSSGYVYFLKSKSTKLFNQIVSASSNKNYYAFINWDNTGLLRTHIFNNKGVVISTINKSYHKVFCLSKMYLISNETLELSEYSNFKNTKLLLKF